MSRSLHTTGLTWEHCESLAPRLAAGDNFECLALGRTPEQSLAMGLLMGPAWAVCRGGTGTPIGAFGYTPQGTVWSLWAQLSTGEAFRVLDGTSAWVREMVHQSGLPVLHNYAACANRAALTWLRLAKCFSVNPDPVAINGHDYLYFETTRRPETPPLEGHPNV